MTHWPVLNNQDFSLREETLVKLILHQATSLHLLLWPTQVSHFLHLDRSLTASIVSEFTDWKHIFHHANLHHHVMSVMRMQSICICRECAYRDNRVLFRHTMVPFVRMSNFLTNDSTFDACLLLNLLICVPSSSQFFLEVNLRCRASYLNAWIEDMKEKFTLANLTS